MGSPWKEIKARESKEEICWLNTNDKMDFATIYFDGNHWCLDNQTKKIKEKRISEKTAITLLDQYYELWLLGSEI